MTLGVGRGPHLGSLGSRWSLVVLGLIAVLVVESAALVDPARHHQSDTLCHGVRILGVAAVNGGRVMCIRRCRINSTPFFSPA